jgi:dipeptidyl aminopeptidase/acylaminoacyl peptidase
MTGCVTADLRTDDVTGDGKADDLGGDNTENGSLIDSVPYELDPAIVDKVASWDEGTRERLARLEISEITYRSDDLAVKGFMLEPKEGIGLPCVIYNRGGNGNFGAISDTDLVFWLSRFADMGYVVVASQYRGNAGSEGYDTFGGDDIGDVLNLIPLLDAHPNADASRIGMYGHSRGGMMTYLAMSMTDRISAAIVDAGVADSIDWVDQRPEIEEVFEERVPGYADNKQQALFLRSGARWAHNLADAPFLILHGDADIRVSHLQAQKMERELTALGRTVHLEVFPDGDHGLSDYTTEVTSWIESWLSMYVR